MTAEVAVLNRHAVALAADSAVTITGARGNKIYNAANKVFALSKREPVGIMVYGNAEFMGVPWETIIKVYRAELGDRYFPKLDDYYCNFLDFLGADDDMFDSGAQLKHVEDTANGMFQAVREMIRTRIDAVTKAQPQGVGTAEIASLQAATIAEFYKQFAAAPLAKGFDAEHERTVRELYTGAIDKSMATVFQLLPLSEDSKNQLRDCIIFVLTRNISVSGESGVVISGFGRKEHFPVLRSCTVQVRMVNRLKHAAYASVDGGNPSIVPFAQTDAVKHFVEGVDPKHSIQSTRLVRKALDGLKQDVLNSLDMSEGDRKAASDEWGEMASQRLREFSEAAIVSRTTTYIHPLMEVIAILPKDELAAVAEALVNITSLRRKMSMGEETVGGPIDVAVISKGDGLIWMKRKHYFRPELNHHFFENYFRAYTSEASHGEGE